VLGLLVLALPLLLLSGCATFPVSGSVTVPYRGGELRVKTDGTSADVDLRLPELGGLRK
jgi:hypothetical protein